MIVFDSSWKQKQKYNTLLTSLTLIKRQGQSIIIIFCYDTFQAVVVEACWGIDQGIVIDAYWQTWWGIVVDACRDESWVINS